ncbi:MAG: hypothetical protein QXM31_04300, partial [Candidatus Woesearchaeota archaeon]
MHKLLILLALLVVSAVIVSAASLDDLSSMAGMLKDPAPKPAAQPAAPVAQPSPTPAMQPAAAPAPVAAPPMPRLMQAPKDVVIESAPLPAVVQPAKIAGVPQAPVVIVINATAQKPVPAPAKPVQQEITPPAPKPAPAPVQSVPEPDLFAGKTDLLVNPPELVIEDHTGLQKSGVKAIITDPETGNPVKLARNKRHNIALNISEGKRITLKGALVKGANLPVRVEEIGSIKGFRSIVAIDLSNIEFDNATYHLRATSHELFKCKDWNYTEQKCKGEWKKIKDTIPGKTYAIKLGPNDPALAEGEGVFFDGFENGFTPNQWLVNGTTVRRWTTSTTNPYEGAQHAQATNTDGPTSLVVNVSTQNYSTITISYARRLVGIDSGDEFAAMWYNGTHWTTLEATGSGTANDATYIVRNYALPASANNNTKFRLEFVCNVDLTNEYCRVDNVRINGTSNDKTPPTIHWINISSTMPFVRDSLCLLANVTDQSGVKSVTASIRMPNGTTTSILLYDGLTCNSVPNDNIFSNHIILPLEGIYNWTLINATDKAGNTGQTTAGIIFEGMMGMTQITNGTAFPNISRYNNGTIIPP